MDSVSTKEVKEMFNDFPRVRIAGVMGFAPPPKQLELTL